MKICTDCGIEKPIEEFVKGRRICIVCRRLERKESYFKAKAKGIDWNANQRGRWSMFKKLAYNVNKTYRQKGEPTKVTPEEIEQHLGEPEKCWLCGEGLTFEETQIDHIYPLSKGGTNTIDNLAYAHSHCNYIKRDHTKEELKTILEKILKNL